MIEKHIQPDFDSCLMKGIHHPTEFDLGIVEILRVTLFWNLKQDGRVSPVIEKPVSRIRMPEGILVFIKFKNRQQLYYVDP